MQPMPEHIRQTTEAALNLAGADAYRRGDIEEAGRIDDALEWLHQQKAMPVPVAQPKQEDDDE